ncbi:MULTISPECIES: hypothetical protein [Rhizobium]|uniref:hypothetical protein n=1 Tax=Rhizobium TaxID=379 RepID=UPI00195B029F|nr:MULTISPECIES: hypothetical protein [Rhizobium]MBM7045236.1 hypothetical protein [Rhizobium lusitanum]
MAAKPNVKIERIGDPDPVEAPLGRWTDFTLIGYGFSEEMDVYISTKADGSDKVNVEVVHDKSATSTDKVWPLVAKPALDALQPNNPTLWVAIKLKDQKGQKGQFEDAYQGFIIV